MLHTKYFLSLGLAVWNSINFSGIWDSSPPHAPMQLMLRDTVSQGITWQDIYFSPEKQIAFKHSRTLPHMTVRQIFQKSLSVMSTGHVPYKPIDKFWHQMMSLWLTPDDITLLDSRWHQCQCCTAWHQVTPLYLTSDDVTLPDTRWCHTVWQQVTPLCLKPGDTTVLDIRCHMTQQQVTPLCLKPGDTTILDTRQCHTAFGMIQANKSTVRWCHDAGELNEMMSWHGSHCHWTTQTLLFLYPLVSCDWALRLLAENKIKQHKL